MISTTVKRRSDLELMGMLVVLGLIFFHTGQIFFDTSFFVTNEPTSIAALVFVAFASLWGMPLMFLISGITAWYSLRKRNTAEFLNNRIRRLLIPFAAGLLLVVPPQIFYGLKADPTYHESYLQFYPRFFDVQFAFKFPLFIKGSPPNEFFQLSTMYFLIDLFIFTLLLLPVFQYLQTPAGNQRVERWGDFFTRRGAIFTLALPIAITEAVLGSGFDGTWDPLAWMFLIFYGFLFACDTRFGRALQKQWKIALVLGLIAFPIWFMGVGLMSTVYEIDAFTSYDPISIAVRFLRGFTGWFWIVAIMGLATRERRSSTQKTQSAGAGQASPLPDSGELHETTFKDRIAAYAREAQLPFYIIHQLPIVVIGFYVVAWDANALLKYLVISLSALIVTLLLYDIGVRRTRVTRFLFGVK